MVDQISARRNQTNAFFLKFYMGSIAVIGFPFKEQLAMWIFVIWLLGGIPLAYFWYHIIRPYR